MPVLTVREQRELAIRRKNLQSFLRFVVVSFALLIIGCLVGNYTLKSRAQPFMYNRIENVPVRETGLLLGTTKWITKGVKNDYFVNRTEAAALLYHNGKIKHIIVSGDSSKYYNEPRELSDALLALGVPSTAITLDYAGFRTYDSVLRCLRKYKQRNITIISQSSHNYRAVFIARGVGMNAIAFNAKAPEGTEGKPNYREFWARLSAIADVCVFKPKLRNLGQPVEIHI
jgi:SanA protein